MNKAYPKLWNHLIGMYSSTHPHQPSPLIHSPLKHCINSSPAQSLLHLCCRRMRSRRNAYNHPATPPAPQRSPQLPNSPVIGTASCSCFCGGQEVEIHHCRCILTLHATFVASSSSCFDCSCKICYNSRAAVSAKNRADHSTQLG
jgi:hypothetical protein